MHWVMGEVEEEGLLDLNTITYVAVVILFIIKIKDMTNRAQINDTEGVHLPDKKQRKLFKTWKGNERGGLL